MPEEIIWNDKNPTPDSINEEPIPHQMTTEAKKGILISTSLNPYGHGVHCSPAWVISDKAN